MNLQHRLNHYRWKRVYNRGPLVLTKRSFQKMRDNRVDIVELFFWNFRKKHVLSLRKAGIEVALGHWFLPKSMYVKKCFLNKTAWVRLYDVRKIISYKKNFLQYSRKFK